MIFKSFNYNAKLLKNTVDQPTLNEANGILENTATVVPLKYLSNFWRSFKVPLINRKVEMKLKWWKHCVLFLLANENTVNANANNIIFTFKDTKLHVAVVNLSASGNQKLPNVLAKGFERLVYWNEYKAISEKKRTNVNGRTIDKSF